MMPGVRKGRVMAACESRILDAGFVPAPKGPGRLPAPSCTASLASVACASRRQVGRQEGIVVVMGGIHRHIPTYPHTHTLWWSAVHGINHLHFLLIWFTSCDLCKYLFEWGTHI